MLTPNFIVVLQNAAHALTGPEFFPIARPENRAPRPDARR
jgi:hypothetical protein